LTIKQVPREKTFLSDKWDYELPLLKEKSKLTNVFDHKLINAMFPSPKKTTIKLSSLENKFNAHKAIKKAALDSLVKKGYYSHLGSLGWEVSVAGFFVGLLWVVLNFGVALPLIFGIPGFVLLAFVVASVVVYAIFTFLSPAKTKTGVAATEHLSGLKLYLKVAEEERINFHNAPEKKPEFFEKLLPYAMIFRLEKKWAQEFESIQMPPPNWYAASPGLSFNAISLGNALSEFRSASTSATIAPSSGGGSGGGGSSGGGGGGGGGSSW
jgi:uncharacterized membrane protein YgcG